jgi:hypothetical protein
MVMATACAISATIQSPFSTITYKEKLRHDLIVTKNLFKRIYNWFRVDMSNYAILSSNF